jgi:ubiquitin carboxyl-terminal hydrolase 4/11/15
LEKNNEWYCKDCKKHQQAFKKLELFFTPKLLILHLKRFEYSSMGRYRTYAEKIGSTIDFPIDTLNLSQYIIGPDSSNSNYELYAVSQHYGSCGGGHYTAIVKNSGKWYDCNDSSVSSSNESSVVSGAAYLLFYRRKDQ